MIGIGYSCKGKICCKFLIEMYSFRHISNIYFFSKTGMLLWAKIRCRNPLPPLHGHTACHIGGTMLVFGGISHGELHDELWCFNFGKILLHFPWQLIAYISYMT